MKFRGAALDSTDQETIRIPGGSRRRRDARPVNAAFVAGEVARQVPKLKRDIETIMLPNAQMEWRSGFASAQRIDLQRAMAFDVDRRGYDRLWCRRLSPCGRRAAVSLLVDLSGSMGGPKIDGAIAGTMVLAEVLSQLGPGVRFAINGFQDELIPEELTTE